MVKSNWSILASAANLVPKVMLTLSLGPHITWLRREFKVNRTPSRQTFGRWVWPFLRSLSIVSLSLQMVPRCNLEPDWLSYSLILSDKPFQNWRMNPSMGSNGVKSSNTLLNAGKFFLFRGISMCWTNCSLEKEASRRATPWRMLEHPWMEEMHGKKVNMEHFLKQVWDWKD